MSRKPGKVSIFTIASELGISASTVSRVINNRAGISESTRRTVNQLLSRYNFRTNYPEMHAKRVAIIADVTHGVNDYMARMLSGVYEGLFSRNLLASTIPVNVEKWGISLLEQMREQQCSAAILLSSPVNYRQRDMDELVQSGLPIIGIDPFAIVPGLSVINNDSYSGSHELAKYLIGLGHRHFGFITRWSDNNSHQARIKGCRDAVQEAGLPQSNLIIYDGDTIDFNYPKEPYGVEASGGELFKLMHSEHPEITAVMAVNDHLAMGALSAAHDLNLRVPEDISIAGFDNVQFSGFTTPSLTTVYHPCFEAGVRAVDLLSLAFQNPEKYTTSVTILSTRLIIRESTGPAPGC